MKHVWIFNHYAQEPGGPGGTRHHALARHLLEHGWQAHVIAASFDHLGGRQRLAPRERRRLQLCAGVPFLWLRTRGYAGNGIGRALNTLTYAVRSAAPRTTRDLPHPHVVIGSSVHPLAPVSAAVVAARFGVPFIFEVRDLWPETLIALGAISRNGLPAILMRKLERWLYERADRILVLFSGAAEYIRGLGVEREKVACLPNGVALEDFPDPPPPAEGDCFSILYLGSHARSNGLDHLLRAYALFQQRHNGRPVVLRLIGDGPEKPKLVDLARRLGLTSVSFEPPVSKQRIPAIAAQADAFVAVAPDMPELYRYGISFNKIYEYMASSRPVVMALAAGNNPIEEAGAGVTVLPEDPGALADAFERIVSMAPAERRAMGKAGRAHVAGHHDFAVLAERLGGLLDAAASRATRSRQPVSSGASPFCTARGTRALPGG